MIELREALNRIGVNQIQLVSIHSEALDNLCERENLLYATAQENKPESSPTHLLLGLFTKLNVEALSSIESHAVQLSEMKSVFDQQLEEKHAKAFRLPVLEELQLVTHIWLYIQGYLGMDYSLANDHATQTSDAISSLLDQNADVLRTDFNQSYYLGFREFEANKPPSLGWKRWFEKWLN